MLLDGHHLDAVVSVLDDTRKHVLGKLLVGAHLLGILSHTHMALIDEERVLARLEGLLLEYVGFLGIPYLSREYLGGIILHNTAAPCGDSLSLTTVPLYLHLIEVAVLHGLGGEFQFPVASALDTLELILLVLLPVVEITDKIYFSGIGSPLAEHPSSTCCLVQSEIEMTGGKVGELDFSLLCQLFQFPLSMVVTSTDSAFERFEP